MIATLWLSTIIRVRKKRIFCWEKEKDHEKKDKNKIIVIKNIQLYLGWGWEYGISWELGWQMKNISLGKGDDETTWVQQILSTFHFGKIEKS